MQHTQLPFYYQNIIDTYTAKAYAKARINVLQWQPALGYKANKFTMYKLYYYYQHLHQQNAHFIWAGLARLTGGQVLWGLKRLMLIAGNRSVITITLVQMAKAIFEHLAWQHELALEHPTLLIEILKAQEQIDTTVYTYSFSKIWTLILSGQITDVQQGNEQLLYNEQLHVIQHYYNNIKQDKKSKIFLWLARFTMRCIHPHHKWFALEFPFKDVSNFSYRWQWISHAKGMWPQWTSLKDTQRQALVNLSNKQIITHQW
jgi:hypothetical protein